MLKLRKILNEGVEPIKVTRFDRSALVHMCEEKVNPINIKDVYDFLVKMLYLKNDEEIVKIIKLYKRNFSFENYKNGECELIVDNIKLPKEEDYDEEKIALAQWLEINPYFLEIVGHPSDGYLAEYRDVIDGQDYRIGDYRNSVFAAKQWVRDTIDGEGYEYFDQIWLESHIEINQEQAEYDAEERAKDDVRHYSDEELRDMIYVTNEYEDLIDDREYEAEELKEKVGEYKIVKFKIEKLEKEKKIIEREIETLGFSLDYDNDDDDGYGEMYNVDISEMTDTLHELETVIFEHLSYIEQIESEIHELEEIIKESNEMIFKYEGEPLKEMAVVSLSEEYLQDYSDDPIAYIESAGFSIAESELEGLISIDEDGVVSEYIAGESLGNILATYDGEENPITFKDPINGEGFEYNIYRT
tara:strand:- start:220 stop:1464 length:1245 start_codon:yes stop_codon:yes gene_type:complete